MSVTLSKYKTDSGLQNRTFGLFVIFRHSATSLDIFFDLFWSETIENILNFVHKIIRVVEDFSSLKTSPIDRHFVYNNRKKKFNFQEKSWVNSFANISDGRTSEQKRTRKEIEKKGEKPFLNSSKGLFYYRFRFTSPHYKQIMK